MSNKIQQHHVWQYYLNAWANNGVIWTLMKPSHLSAQKSDKIAHARYFYRVTPPTKQENEFAKKFYELDKMSSGRRKLAEKWITAFELLYFANELMINDQLTNANDNNTVKSFLINAEEDIHTYFESGAIQYYDSMRNKSFDFLLEQDNRAKFFNFLSIQYLRTERIKKRIISALSENQMVQQAISKTWNYGKFILAINMGHSFFSKANIKIYINKTDLPFITGDQPAINLDATSSESKNPPEKMTLYYPISSEIALIIHFEQGNQLVVEDISDIEMVSQFNDKMFEWSERQVYSINDEALRKYVSNETSR